MKGTKHVPVMLKEVVEGLHLTNGDTVVDATLGGGGHALEIARKIFPERREPRQREGRLVAIDADSGALERFRAEAGSDAFLGSLLTEERLMLIHGNYGELGTILENLRLSEVDAIVADLGFSSDQIEDPSRGFSFMEDGPLDMRLNQGTELTAERIVNTYSESDLARLLREYGDESESRRIVRAIIHLRKEKPLETTGALRECIEKALPKKFRGQYKIHPATKTFQALRIAVNQEYEHLEKFLDQAVEKLKPGGRLGIISFHSGEDRIVKQKFRVFAKGCICPPEFPLCRCGRPPLLRIITTKPLEPTEEEKRLNPRSRSAKLRIAEKI